MVIQAVLHQPDDVLRHVRIDFFGQTDEARFKAVQPRLPRQVMRVERDTVMDIDAIRRSEGVRIVHNCIPLDPHYLSWKARLRSEEHTSELQSRFDLVCRLLLE